MNATPLPKMGRPFSKLSPDLVSSELALYETAKRDGAKYNISRRARELGVKRDALGYHLRGGKCRRYLNKMNKQTISETHIQQAVMNWWAMAHKGLGVRHVDSLMAFPLQGKRNVIAGRRLKTEGMRKGTSDMLLAVPSAGSGGLWIELKKEGGRVSPEQSDFLDHRRESGYGAVVCYSFEQCIAEIEKYLGKKPARTSGNLLDRA